MDVLKEVHHRGVLVVHLSDDDVNESHGEGLTGRLEVDGVGLVHGVRALQTIVEHLPGSDGFTASSGMAVIQTAYAVVNTRSVGNGNPLQVTHGDVANARNGVAKPFNDFANRKLIGELGQIHDIVVISQSNPVRGDDRNRGGRRDIKHVDAPIVEGLGVEVGQPRCEINGCCVFISQIDHEVEVNGLGSGFNVHGGRFRGIPMGELEVDLPNQIRITLGGVKMVQRPFCRHVVGRACPLHRGPVCIDAFHGGVG